VRTASLFLAIAACTKPAPTSKPPDTHMAELAALMKNHINPAFSKLTFLVFHGDELQEDPAATRAEMQRAAVLLRGSIGKLREWKQPPTQTTQGREVFYTYAASVEQSTVQLAGYLERGETDAAAKQMEQIATTCNNCHHFFRLKVEDSIVPAR
jgi:hypothetical protein